MAHEIENAFYTKTGAWHGLGTVLENAPTLDQALKLAGLDWSVYTEQLYLHDGKPVTTHKAIIRDSDHSQLGVVGADYQPVQNSKAFEPFAPLIDRGLIELEAGGSLREGKRVWLLGKYKADAVEVVPGDTILPYFVMYTSHDGSLRMSYQNTATRVVCNNTVEAAYEESKNGREKAVRFKHSSGVNERIDAFKGQMDRAIDKFNALNESFRSLARKDVGSTAQLENYFRASVCIEKVNATAESLLGIRPDKESDTGKRVIPELLECYHSQPGKEYASGSYWQAYNAVTYWLDHARGKSADTRLNGSWFGDGAKIRTRALHNALNA